MTSHPDGGAARVPGERRSRRAVNDVAVEARIRRFSAEGASPHTIAAALNADGLVTGAGRRWHRTSVAKVLWNRPPGGQAWDDVQGSQSARAETSGRSALLKRADAVRSAGGVDARLALLVMDVDDFRHINSSFGHPSGDAVLDQIGRRLQGITALDAFASRIGGDAFAVLTSVPAGCPEAMPEIMNAVRTALSGPFHTVTGEEVTATLTMGLACDTAGAASAHELLRNAELAMYRAKEGHTSWAVYAADLDEERAAGLIQATELRAAIAAGQVTVHYQPVVDVRTGLVHSVEALARWRHPQRGLVPPADFLPLAVSFGLMGELTEAVIARVRTDLSTWSVAGRPMRCAVNVTATCLTDPPHGERIVRALSELSGSITIEVVESVMADAAAIRVLERLAAAGVPCAIDDFGTGYSCLGSLKTLPAATLKIDRSLITDIERDSRDVELVHALVRLATSYDLDIIVEGIETEEALLLLRTAGVHLAQGFLFGRPMPAQALARWLEASPRVLAPVRAEVSPEQVPDHAVVVHSGEEELSREVVSYLTEGLAAEGGAIAVVTPAHRASLLSALTPAGERAEREGRLLVLDARETLDLFMRDGSPDPELFDVRVAGLVRQRLRSSPELHAFGEMTTLLWQDGNVAGALALEGLWNDLLQEESFSLLCACPAGDLLDDHGTSLADLCRAHSAVRIASPAESPVPAEVAAAVGVLLDSTRALLRIDVAEQAVGVLIQAVSALGGSTVPAHAALPGSLPIDISLGHADPVLPTAPVDSSAHEALTTLLPALVEDARVAAHRAEQIAALSEAVETDPLTGLSNRRGLRHARRLTDEDCVVMVDLDRFKEVDDSHGHDAGDRLLVAFSRAARQHLRATDLVFRLGGDEFLVVLPGTTADAAELVMEDLRRHWDRERPLPVSFSAGISTVDGNDLEQSIKAADAALYRQKHTGRNAIGVASAGVVGTR